MSPEHATTLARYNQWQNDNLYTACGSLSDGERKKERGLFFGSIHGTLNHLLLADKIWLGRFKSEPFRVTGLDQELFSEFEALKSARKETDQSIIDWTAAQTETSLAADLHYRTVDNPTDRCCPLWLAATHLFNHQTHHRGQITTALSQLDIDYGITDLIYLPQLVNEAM